MAVFTVGCDALLVIVVVCVIVTGRLTMMAVVPIVAAIVDAGVTTRASSVMPLHQYRYGYCCANY